LYFVYQIRAEIHKRSQSKPDKIVDNRPMTMAVSDWIYDADKGQLVWTLPNGKWELNVSDDRMNGTLTLPDGTLFRKIQVKRAN
jgi:hypothetical protein